MNIIHLSCIAGALVWLSVPAAGAAASTPFGDAVAVWQMADLNDTAAKNSALSAMGDVKCGVRLDGAEREASLRRGGDGYVARFDGGWLDAGQGADGELNLTGDAMTTVMRVRDPSGKWGSPLFGKKDVGTRLAYSIVSGGQLAAATHWPEQPNLDGTNPVFLAELGSDAVAGMHQVKTLAEPLGLTDWHDVVLRFDGKTMQLFVDGNLRDDEAAISALRSNKIVPCLIGAEPCEVIGNVNGGMETNASGAVITPELRPEIVFDNFESGNYKQWTVEGEAFGKQPSKVGELPHSEPIKNREGNYLVDSMLNLSDAPTGRLTSVPFTIPRRHISFRIAGGNHAGRTCINLLVDGKVVRSAAGDNSETLVPKAWDVSDLEGKQAQLEIVDAVNGRWGHVIIDQIVLTDLLGVKPVTFHGLVDHVALWNRALSDAEIATISGVSQVGDKRPQYYGEKYRPQFHFSAQKHWLNDPNGLVYYEGVYHLCFQLWPPGRPPAYKEWGHAVSTDLVHWKQVPSAITPHEIWGGCWSGSAAVDWKNTTGLQTGKDKPIVAILTTGGKDPNIQSLAYSVDGAKTFQYYDKNPVLGHIAGLNRDPKVVWHAPTQKWIMALYLAGNDYWMFASPDMKSWEKICNLNLPGVTECPDLFPLSVDGDPTKTKWVFWGADGNYLVGAFDGRAFNQEGGMQKADYGNAFYAAQTWSDIPPADGRRIQIAWMGVGEYPGMPFNQQMSFPTEVTLRNTSDGLRLYRMPVREIAKLHQREKTWTNVVLKPGDNPFAGITGDLFDIRAEFELGDAKVLGIKVRGQPVQYDVAAKTLSCRGRSAPLSPENGRIKLRMLVDRTSVEVFGNDGRVVLSCCFLPSDDNQSLEMDAQAGNAKLISAKVYPLKSIWSQPAAESVPAKIETKETSVSEWEMGPFVKRPKPILSPTLTSKFQCPILGREVRWEEQNVYNPAAVVRNGKIYLLYRADDRNPELKWGRTCRIGLASSEDGINFTRHPTPVLYPDNDAWKKYEWEGGIEDLHIVEDEDGTYYMNYTTWSGSGDTMSVATSRDLFHWTKHGPAFRKGIGTGSVGGRSGVAIARRVGDRLIATKINGKYWMYYTHPCALIWSDDLISWTHADKSVWGGGHEAGAIALLRDKDIVLMYNTCGQIGGSWTLGQALIDRKDLTTVLKDPNKAFLHPELEWERKGFTDPAVVANTLVPFKGQWLLYYGAADRYIGLAVFTPAAGSSYQLTN